MWKYSADFCEIQPFDWLLSRVQQYCYVPYSIRIQLIIIILYLEIRMHINSPNWLLHQHDLNISLCWYHHWNLFYFESLIQVQNIKEQIKSKNSDDTFFSLFIYETADFKRYYKVVLGCYYYLRKNWINKGNFIFI